MKREMKKALFFIIVLVVVFPFSAFAGHRKTVEGRMEGLNCVIEGHVCPRNNLDPHIACESDFVLTPGKDKYYLLLDIPLVVKGKYVGEEIRVTGEVFEKSNAMKVEELEVKSSGNYKKVWTKADWWKEWQKQFYEGKTTN